MQTYTIILMVVACVVLGLSIWAFVTRCNTDKFGSCSPQQVSCDISGDALEQACCSAKNSDCSVPLKIYQCNDDSGCGWGDLQKGNCYVMPEGKGGTDLIYNKNCPTDLTCEPVCKPPFRDCNSDNDCCSNSCGSNGWCM